MRETKLGWVASSTLKPQKKANSNHAKAAMEGAPEDTHNKTTCTSAMSVIEAKNTARKKPRRSSGNNNPPINTNEPNTAGK